MFNAANTDMGSIIEFVRFILCIYEPNAADNKYKIIRKKLLSSVPFIGVGLICVSSVISLYGESHDFLKLIETLFVASGFLQGAFKVLFLRKMFNDLTVISETCKKFKQEFAEDVENKRKSGGMKLTVKMIIILFGIFVILCISLISIQPLMGKSRSLPLHIYLPLGPPLVSPYYQINYFFFVVELVWLMLFVISIDGIFIMLVSEMCLQCDVLMDKLSTLGSGGDDQELLRIVQKMHWNTWRLAVDVDGTFSKMFLIQFFSSFVMISTALFMSTKQHYLFVVMAFCDISQLGMYCTFGQRIKNKFDALVFALYNNEWFNLPLKERKSFIIMMSFAQATPTLKAGGYIDLTMETYMEILKLAYSYLTIMKNIQPEE